jgi:tetratricopeptide (TPR) repeat protein
VPAELQRLIVDLQWAKENCLPQRELRAMLKKLVDKAPRDSEERRFAQRELAECLLPDEPWRAARLAKDVLQAGPDARACGVLGLAHTLLGNYRAAQRAYRAALELDPGSPEYQHNLGHLLDVALGRPRAALPFLERAHALLPEEPEIKSSLAHALLSLGSVDKARRLLREVFEGDADRAALTLRSWQANGGA